MPSQEPPFQARERKPFVRPQIADIPQTQAAASPSAAPVGPSREELMSGPANNAEAIRQIMGLGELRDKKAYAQQLRDMKMPEGRYVRRGIYVGASPLEHLATGIRKFKGKRDADRIGKEQTAAREKYASITDLLRGL
jgi:hypothetical protein